MQEIDDISHLTSLTLYDNPLSCPCDNATFKNWIQSHANIIGNIQETKCNGTAFISLPDDNFICYDNRKVHEIFTKQTDLRALLSLATTLPIAFVLIVSLLIMSFKHSIVLQVMLYSHCGIRLRRRKESQFCRFDAFVVYNEDNRDTHNWVNDTLVMRILEHNSSFQIESMCNLSYGGLELDSIHEAISQSRRTIIVMDNRTHLNPRVIHSFDTAFHRMKNDDHTHDILFILREDFDTDACIAALEENNTEAESFAAYLKTGKRLKMSHRRFWKELFFFLPRPTCAVQQSGPQQLLQETPDSDQARQMAVDVVSILTMDNQRPDEYSGDGIALLTV